MPLNPKQKFAVVFYALLAVVCLGGLLSPPLALGCGVCLALTVGPLFPKATHTATKYLLQVSIVGLGFGMNLAEVWLAGKTGFGFTVATLTGTLLAGWLLGRALRVESKTSCLISSGTAICGGSAIAAVTPNRAASCMSRRALR